MSIIIEDIEVACQALLTGHNVAIPTETVYGLAALVSHEKAIENIFTLKKRPKTHPLIMHVAPEWDLSQWLLDIPDYARQLMESFWPGPLTLVLPCKPDAISPLINANQNSLAIRAPSHPMALQLLRRCKTPLVAPSANPFGKVSPTTARHVQQSFPNDDLLILEGGRCTIGIESSIVSALNPKHWQLLRPGIIDSQRIEQCTQSKEEVASTDIRVPGKMPTHYQPEKVLYYFQSEADLLVFIDQHPHDVFVLHDHCPENQTSEYFAHFPKDPQEAAWALYHQLRIADESSATCIALCLPQACPENQGLRERIQKAGQAG